MSRTATAPFDRLRVFLITRSTDINPLSTDTLLHPERSVRAIGRAILKIHAESGVIGFWIGNGLNITKIFPVRSDVFLWGWWVRPRWADDISLGIGDQVPVLRVVSELIFLRQVCFFRLKALLSRNAPLRNMSTMSTIHATSAERAGSFLAVLAV